MSAGTAPARTRHVPVLLAETLEVFGPLLRRPGPVRILDGTLCLGGHSEALLAAGPRAEILGLDRDSEALSLASERLAPFGNRLRAVHCRFSEFAGALDQAGWSGVDGALLDVGVSSMQLDESRRGFGIHGDGPLDMRMDPSCGTSARELVNGLDEARLRELVASFGEDPMAARIARAICSARARAPIETTGRLAEVVAGAYPPSWRAKSRRHPATRTFQAIRMAVNDELGELRAFLDSILGRLRPGGRLCVISFHSLEDRMVKRAMREWSRGCVCPPSARVCTCGHVPEARVPRGKPLTASPEELASNPRASSARLRWCERLAPPESPEGGA